MYLTQSATYDHDLHYQLDVVGLADISNDTLCLCRIHRASPTKPKSFVPNLTAMETKST